MYRAVLEPYAFADLLDYFSHDSFGALGVLDKRSYFTDRLGEKVFDEKISIADDALDPRGLPKAFDFEGTPKRRVQLVEAGVARSVVWDRATAAQAGNGAESTGHAPPAELRDWGPLPSALSVLPGDAESVEELAELVGDGLYITRLHYLGVVHPREGIITGMTRDGTFRIRDGKIAEPLVNLRFTVAVPDLLRDVLGLTNKAVARELAELLRRALPVRRAWRPPSRRSASRSRASARSPGSDRRVVDVSRARPRASPPVAERRAERRRPTRSGRRARKPRAVRRPTRDQRRCCVAPQRAQQQRARLQLVAQDELRRNRLLLRIDGEHALQSRRSGRRSAPWRAGAPGPTSRHCAYRSRAPARSAGYGRDEDPDRARAAASGSRRAHRRNRAGSAFSPPRKPYALEPLSSETSSS